jgi:hypothetical protein
LKLRTPALDNYDDRGNCGSNGIAGGMNGALRKLAQSQLARFEVCVRKSNSPHSLSIKSNLLAVERLSLSRCPRANKASLWHEAASAAVGSAAAGGYKLSVCTEAASLQATVSSSCELPISSKIVKPE